VKSPGRNAILAPPTVYCKERYTLKVYGFELLTAVNMKEFCLLGYNMRINRRIDGKYRLHLQG
jgi:hypothetical protein